MKKLSPSIHIILIQHAALIPQIQVSLLQLHHYYQEAYLEIEIIYFQCQWIDHAALHRHKVSSITIF